MSYKCTEEQFKICENNSKCYLCDGSRLYKEPKWMKLRKQQEARKASGAPKKKKEGMDFEKRVTKKYNKALGSSSGKQDPARRRPNSGAIWSMPGDISTETELMECKERGTHTSKGEKLISIQKQQLDKIRDEAYFAKKNVWYYLFGFKGCDSIYVAKDFNDELAMLQQIKMLKEHIIELEERVKELEDEDR